MLLTHLVFFSFLGGASVADAPPAPAIRGPALQRIIVVRRPPPAVFAYTPRGGISVGGTAETSFEPAPVRVYSYHGHARVRLGGQASVTYFDMGAHIRRLDDELLLMA